MTQSEAILLSLVKRSLFGIEEPLPSSVDWNAVFQEAQDQAVVGIVAPMVPRDCLPEIQAKWNSTMNRHVSQQVRYWYAQDQLDKLLTKNEIPYVILKGATAAMNYPDPLRRTMGDIDFLVPPNLFEHTKTLLLQNGYVQIHEQNDRNIGLSKDHFVFELHRSFSYCDLNMDDVLLDGLSRSERKTVENHGFWALPTIENGLVLLGHLWGHLHTGVGLRQILDWILFVHDNLNDELWNTVFSPLARTYGLEKLAITTAYLGKKYLGLPDNYSWYANADETLCYDLLSQVLHFGNFDRKATNKTLADMKVQGALSSIHRYGFFRLLQQRGEVHWEACHRHPWLKPFAWLYQIIRYPVLWLIMPKQYKLSALVQKENKIHDLLVRLK